MFVEKFIRTAKDKIRKINETVEDIFMTDNTSTNPRSLRDDIDVPNSNEDVMEQTQKFDMKDALNRFKRHSGEFKNNVDDMLNSTDTDEAPNTDIDTIGVAITSINERFEELLKTSTKSKAEISNLVSMINDVDRKMTDISGSVSGVNKINDSIFDLKNAQINTKNSLNDLELSFRKLKKKTTAGIITLSIISFVVAVLEVINILS